MLNNNVASFTMTDFNGYRIQVKFSAPMHLRSNSDGGHNEAISDGRCPFELSKAETCPCLALSQGPSLPQ